MIRRQLQQVEPEQRNLREDLAFARNACAQHMIEGRDAVGRHHQQRIAHRVEIAHFAAAKQGSVPRLVVKRAVTERSLPRTGLNLRLSGGAPGLSIHLRDAKTLSEAYVAVSIRFEAIG